MDSLFTDIYRNIDKNDSNIDEKIVLLIFSGDYVNGLHFLLFSVGMPSCGTQKEGFLSPHSLFPAKRAESVLCEGLAILFDNSERNISGCHGNPT